MSISTFLFQLFPALVQSRCNQILTGTHTQTHYNDVIMGTITSQITSLTSVYSPFYSDADQRKYQSSASLAFVREIHRGPVNFPHKWPVTRKMSPFDDVIMTCSIMIIIPKAETMNSQTQQVIIILRWYFRDTVKPVCNHTSIIKFISCDLYSNVF